LFFGLCAAAFLPAFVGGLFFRRATRAGAIASMITGFVLTAAWLVFVKDKEARGLGICKFLTGKHSLLGGMADGSAPITTSWYVVDAMVVALPVSLLVMIAVSLLTKRPDDEHLAKCFPSRAGRRA